MFTIWSPEVSTTMHHEDSVAGSLECVQRFRFMPSEGHSNGIPCISRDEERFPFWIRPDGGFLGGPDIERPVVQPSQRWAFGDEQTHSVLTRRGIISRFLR